MKIISVFGSNQPPPGHPDYELAYDVGRRLAQAGLAVATGGYIGTMTAVSQGAAEAGGHVIGVTCDQIETWRPVSPNRWIAREIRYRTLLERIAHLVAENDGIIALPGGIGTLAEVSLAWNQLQTGAMPSRPLVVLGEHWRRTLRAFLVPDYVPAASEALVQFADTPEEAVALLT